MNPLKDEELKKCILNNLKKTSCRVTKKVELPRSDKEQRIGSRLCNFVMMMHLPSIVKPVFHLTRCSL